MAQGNRSRQAAAAPAGENENLTQRVAREVFMFEVPPDLMVTSATFGEIKTLGIVELTPLEEKAAAKRSGGDAMNLAYELTQMSFHEVNGRLLTNHDGAKELAFMEIGSQLRNLLIEAYSEISVAPEPARALFLKSRRIKA